MTTRATRVPDGEGVVEARNHFLGRISHELRNILATMKTAAYCLKDDPREKLSPRQAQMVDMISRNIDRQTRLVENILDLARLRSDKLKVTLRRSDPAAIIADLAAEYRLSRAGRMLQVSVDRGVPSVDCDPDLIAQVLRNLLDNALRYAKEKVAIEVSKAGDARVRISVTDDGGGIPEARLEGLFTYFDRLEAPASDDGHKGTGLGLAICREIIESHHGIIRAGNVPGSGARFSFDLPVSRVPGTTRQEESCAGAAR
jgi:signal transduction histidine kinase